MEKVSIKTIQEYMFKAMASNIGRHDLYWIGCLFEHELHGDLGIEKGYLAHDRHDPNALESKLNQIGVYGYGGYSPLAQLFSQKIPKDYLLFVIGPKEFKKSPIKVCCIAPIITGRDKEEQSILKELDRQVSKKMKGKHVSVKGKLILPKLEDQNRYARIMEKIFGPLVKPDAYFRNDIEDLVVCSKIYRRFEEYQQQEDSNAKNKAKEIIVAISGEFANI